MATLCRDTMVLPWKEYCRSKWLRERESVIDQPLVFIYPPAGGFSSTSACSGLAMSGLLC